MWRSVIHLVFGVAQNILHVVAYIGKPILDVFRNSFINKKEQTKTNGNDDTATPVSSVIPEQKYVIIGNNNKIIHCENNCDKNNDSDKDTEKTDEVKPSASQEAKDLEQISPEGLADKTAESIGSQIMVSQPIPSNQQLFNVNTETPDEWETKVTSEPSWRDKNEKQNHLDLPSIPEGINGLHHLHDILSSTKKEHLESASLIRRIVLDSYIERETVCISDTASEPSTSDQSEKHEIWPDLASILSGDNFEKYEIDATLQRNAECEDLDNYDDTSSDIIYTDVAFNDTSRTITPRMTFDPKGRKCNEIPTSSKQFKDNGLILYTNKDNVPQINLDLDSGSDTRIYEILLPKLPPAENKPISIYEKIKTADSESDSSDSYDDTSADKSDTNMILPDKLQVYKIVPQKDWNDEYTRESFMSYNMNNGDVQLPYREDKDSPTPTDSDSDSDCSVNCCSYINTETIPIPAETTKQRETLKNGATSTHITDQTTTIADSTEQKLSEAYRRDETENLFGKANDKDNGANYEQSIDDEDSEKCSQQELIERYEEAEYENDLTSNHGRISKYEDENESHYEEIPFSRSKVHPNNTTQKDPKVPTKWKGLRGKKMNKVSPVKPIKHDPAKGAPDTAMAHNENLDISKRKLNTKIPMFNVEQRPRMPLPQHISASYDINPNIKHNDEKNDDSFLRDSHTRKPVRRKKVQPTTKTDQNHNDGPPTRNKGQQVMNRDVTYVTQKMLIHSKSVTDGKKDSFLHLKQMVTNTDTQVVDSDNDLTSPFQRKQVIRRKKKKQTRDASTMKINKGSQSIHTTHVENLEIQMVSNLVNRKCINSGKKEAQQVHQITCQDKNQSRERQTETTISRTSMIFHVKENIIGHMLNHDNIVLKDDEKEYFV